MSIEYRLAQMVDINILIKFQDYKKYFPCYVGFEKPEQIRKVIKDSYKKNQLFLCHPETFPTLLAFDYENKIPLGYIATVTGVEESITGEKQLLIYDFHILDVPEKEEIFNHFIDFAENQAIKYNLSYMITEIPFEAEELENMFHKKDFSVEMNRIVKLCSHHEFTGKRQENIKVRPGEESDRFFMMLLNAQNSGFLIPADRKASSEEIQQKYFEHYSQMPIDEEPFLHIFIAEDLINLQPAGYIIIKTSAIDQVSRQSMAYIYDLNVHKDYWGKYVTQRLVKEAENWLVEDNIHLLIGDISDSNPRPLKTALKTLNFTLYSRRWVKEPGKKEANKKPQAD
ncbi:MAG: GNAT family N-acetyltransferase [Vulcanimicrobiota bacterium]